MVFSNGPRHDKSSKPKIMVLDVVGDVVKSTASYSVRRGEYILMHYFPSSVSESHSPQWKIDSMIGKNTPSFTWGESHKRRISFQMLFNEYGEDFKFDKVSPTNGFRKGLLNVSDSLQFLRDISRPAISSGDEDILAPPLIAVFGLFDLEVFVGFVTSLKIDIQYWSKTTNQVSFTGKSSAQGGKFSQYNRAMADLKNIPPNVVGWGAIPVRATVDITVAEGFRELEKSTIKKQTGKGK